MMLFILFRNSVGCLVGSLGWLASMVHFFSTGMARRVFLRSSDKSIVFYIGRRRRGLLLLHNMLPHPLILPLHITFM